MIETWTITKLLDWTTEYLKKYDIEWPHLEAEILLAHSLGIKRIELYTNHEKVLSPEELGKFKALIQRRSQREPIAYITGVQPFMSIEFMVNRSVLIPRPETERLVELAIDIPCSTIADIGTGSGAIAITLAKYKPDAKVVAIDSSIEALKAAKINAEKHNLSNRIEFRQGNLLDPLTEKFDLLISNPPYIPSKEIDKLETDVKDWEPRGALDGGEDGLDYVRQIIALSPDHLTTQGNLLIEIDYSQGARVKELTENNGNYREIEILKDLNNKDRILKATKI